MNEFLTVAKNLDIRELAKGIEDGDSTVNKDDTNTETEESPIHADDVGEPSKQDINDATDGQHKTQQAQTVTKRHMYECQQCDKAYTKTTHLTTHIQSVHEGVRYACNQCDYQATTQRHLTRHIQSKHKGV